VILISLLKHTPLFIKQAGSMVNYINELIVNNRINTNALAIKQYGHYSRRFKRKVDQLLQSQVNKTSDNKIFATATRVESTH
jgi:hypothetical protein